MLCPKWNIVFMAVISQLKTQRKFRVIQMGDWYSEELISKLNETTAMVRKSMTA